MPTILKLDYPVISPDHQVWFVRPGKNYRLAEAFHENSAFGPDFPFLSIEDGASVSPNSLIQQACRAWEWRDWEKNAHSNFKTPSQSLDDYNINIKGGSGHTLLRKTATLLLDEIPDGALIFIPGANLDQKALLGIATGKRNPRIRMQRTVRGQEIMYMGRSLQNPIVMPMRDLPKEITDIRKNNSAITSLIENQEKTRIYREYFGSFSLGDNDFFAEFKAGNCDFPSSALTNLLWLIALSVHSENMTRCAKLDGKSIKQLERHELLDLMWNIDNSVSVHAKINSPFGKAIFQAPSIATLIAIMALVSLAALDADADVIKSMDNRNLKVENVCQVISHMTDKAKIQADSVRDSLFDFYAVVGKDTCEDVLKAARKTANSADGQVSAKAENDK